MKKNYRHFNLNANIGNDRFRVVFKQPLTLKANSVIEVKAVSIYWTAAAGYRSLPFAVLTDLPINTFFAKVSTNAGNITEAVENKVLIHIPANQNDDVTGDDPAAGLPTIALRTYEPFQEVVHYMDNNELSINAINFSIVNGETLEPAAHILEASLSFCIYENC